VNAPLRKDAYAVSASPCGAALLSVASEAAHLRPSGALWLEAARTLVVADLHFEKGSSFAARGQLLPPYDTGETLRRLEGEVAATAPTRLVFLGDSFHDGGALSRISGCDVERLAALAQRCVLTWIAGNHDAETHGGLPGEAAEEVRVGALTLRHEPQPGVQPGEVAGHLHPSARITALGRSVRRRCFITDGERLILPAFGAYAGGLNVRDQAFAGLFARRPLIVALGPQRAQPVAWGSLLGN
jgi:DNA ligase-associated metallophosphoesterase